MTTHILKLCVGVDAIEDLAGWQAERVETLRRAGQPAELFHRTLQTPKRRDDVLAGGSLYWVIKGLIQVRQRIVDIREGKKDDGTPCCLLMLDKALVPVRPTPRRAFQGWRYLAAEDAPADLAGASAGAVKSLPPRMRKELADLGLL